MTIVLETERLLLRQFREADARSLWLMEQDPEVMRFVGRKPLADVESYRLKIQSLHNPLDSFVGFGSWAIVEKACRTFVGACSLRRGFDVRCARELDYRSDDTEIGYGLCRSVWGNGFATEIVGALIQRAFVMLNTACLVACVMVENLASIRVLEKSGFQRSGKPICLPGEAIESVKYSLFRADYEKLIAGSIRKQRRAAL
jgi:ribosomal-protein-alanine N-acetyltransferase